MVRHTRCKSYQQSISLCECGECQELIPAINTISPLLSSTVIITSQERKEFVLDAKVLRQQTSGIETKRKKATTAGCGGSAITSL